ncbi:MAG: glycosyltransferase family 4 protein [Acidobacteria bacterium]|nr:glycosyltransferase family 4 protein [Acidobacteriota bacterium]
MGERRSVVIGPVYPFRSGVAYCSTRLAETLGQREGVEIVSFSRIYPRRFYPGGDPIDPSLVARTPANARFSLDIFNPFTWIREGLRLRRERPARVIFVWWIWVWALPYIVMSLLLPNETEVVFQCHNVRDKEPSWWKSWLTNRAIAGADIAIVHANTEGDAIEERLGAGAPRVIRAFLPIHEIPGVVPSRETARTDLSITHSKVALFFGHIRPFKGLDVALRAWQRVEKDVLLFVSGEVWFGDGTEYRELAAKLGIESRVRFDFEFIPETEVAARFAAANVVLVPYLRETQSGVVMTSFWFGRPVIATDVGGLAEVVEEGENGLLVPAGDPQALANAVNRYFDGGEGWLEEGALRAVDRYGWERYVDFLMAGDSDLENRP